MWGMRNRIVHGYLLIEPGIVGLTVAEELPVVVASIHRKLG